MGPTWGRPGSCRPQMGTILAPWTLLSGTRHLLSYCRHWSYQSISSEVMLAGHMHIHNMCKVLCMYKVLLRDIKSGIIQSVNRRNVRYFQLTLSIYVVECIKAGKICFFEIVFIFVAVYCKYNEYIGWRYNSGYCSVTVSNYINKYKMKWNEMKWIN